MAKEAPLDRDIIRSSKIIRGELAKRFHVLKMNYEDISADGKKYGVSIDQYRLSRYFNQKPHGAISQYALLWLCARWCIDVDVKIKTRKLVKELPREVVEQKYRKSKQI